VRAATDTTEAPASTRPGEEGLRLNLGCGFQAPDGWVNLDSSPGARLCGRPRLARLLRAVLPARLLPAPGWEGIDARWMDLTRAWPLASGAAEAVYSSHFLEHLDADEGRHVLAEAHRVLRPGGRIRLVVPDLEAIVADYRRDLGERPAEAASRFLASTCFFMQPAPRSWRDFLLFRVRRKNNHHVLHDEPGLRALLEGAGFTGVRRRACGDSDIPGIAAIDQPDRFVNALCLEARKP